MSTRIETLVVKDAAEMARQMAARIRSLSQSPGEAPLAIALAGGSTPRRLYETLAEPAVRAQIRWERLEFFFGDERAVPPDHPDSNYGMAWRALLSQVPATAHRMQAEAGAAAAYEELLRSRIAARHDGFPVFDLILLGMGQDGHTASLFPGTAALHESARWVVMNDVPQLGTRRMTLTYPVINAARRVWILISGGGKREIVGQCLAARSEAGREKQWPVLGVHPADGELIWWLDAVAAGRA